MATVADELMLAEMPEETRAMLRRLCEEGTIYDVLDVAVYGDCPVCENDDGSHGGFTERDMIDAYLRGKYDARGNHDRDIPNSGSDRGKAKHSLLARGMI